MYTDECEVMKWRLHAELSIITFLDNGGSLQGLLIRVVVLAPEAYPHIVCMCCSVQDSIFHQLLSTTLRQVLNHAPLFRSLCAQPQSIHPPFNAGPPPRHVDTTFSVAAHSFIFQLQGRLTYKRRFDIGKSTLRPWHVCRTDLDICGRRWRIAWLIVSRIVEETTDAANTCLVVGREGEDESTWIQRCQRARQCLFVE